MSIESRKHQYGKIFGHWKIMEFLGSGSGGKSAVFRLEHVSSPRVESALKVVTLVEERGSFDALSETRKEEYLKIRAELTGTAEQEVLLMNQFQGNTNIVDYLDHTFADWSDATGFGRDMLIRMEKLTDLRAELSRGRIFTAQEVIRIGRDICAALILCHEKLIVHRDIKPENIFFNRSGSYKLGDFGVSRILDTSSFKASTGIGTPQYWAPEQISGNYDQRVDIYSLGLVLYELCNRNRLPFATSTYVREAEVQRRMLGTPLPEPAGAEEPLARVILKACAYRPEDRYQSAEEFLAALNSLMAAQPEIHGTPDRYQTAAARPSDLNQTVPAAGQYRTEPARSSDLNQTVPAAGQYRTEPARPTEDIRNISGQTPTPPEKPRVKLFLILLLILAGCAAFALFGRDGKQDDTGDSPATEAPATVVTEAPETVPTEPPPPTPREVTAGIMAQTDRIGAGGRQSVVILSDGTAVAAGDWQYGACNVSGWSNLTAVSSGDYYTLGLRSDGTVVAVGDNQYGQCNVSGWRNVIAIAAGDFHSVGVTEDGVVLVTGWNEYGQCQVERLNRAVTDDRKIIAAGASFDHTVVLYSDGTVDAVGDNRWGQCNVSGWTDVVAVYAGVHFTVALRGDGTVLATGDNADGQCNVSGWQNVAMITAGDFHTVAVTTNGQILSTGQSAAGQRNFSGWENIVAIGAGCRHTVAITSDGRILATGENKFGQCNVAG